MCGVCCVRRSRDAHVGDGVRVCGSNALSPQIAWTRSAKHLPKYKVHFCTVVSILGR